MVIREKFNPSARLSRSALIDSLIELMHEKIFQSIHIQEIIDRAELSRQTLYINFTSKKHILKYALEILFEMIEEENQTDTVSGFLIMYFNYWKKHMILLEVLFQQSLDYLFLEDNLKNFEKKDSCLGTDMKLEKYERLCLKNYSAAVTYTLLKT